MKKIMFATLVAIAATSGFVGYFNQPSKQEMNALALANLEAITDNENAPCSETCSQADGSASCYKPNGDWVCLRITSVREYVRTSCIQICYHDRITECPKGTYER